jgi:hypothetical protein
LVGRVWVKHVAVAHPVFAHAAAHFDDDGVLVTV